MTQSNRKFLTFKTPFDRTENNDVIDIYTDSSGNFAFLARITLRQFAKVAQKHFAIVDDPKILTEEFKLKELVELWQQIDDRISGYLFGDLDLDVYLET